jgi:hypothetical protein
VAYKRFSLFIFSLYLSYLSSRWTCSDWMGKGLIRIGILYLDVDSEEG